jgi:3-oxoacyl-[acyl-carrier-protein] synthase II
VTGRPGPAVVVTGLGAITSLGADVPSTWAGLLAGRSGISALTGPDYADLPVRIGGRVTADPAASLPRPMARKLDRFEQFAVVAAREAWADSGLAHPAGPELAVPELAGTGLAGTGLAGTGAVVPGDRVAVAIGSCMGGLSSLFEYGDALAAKGPRYVSPFAVAKIIPDAAAAWVSLDLGATAAVETPVAACATGNDAIGRGAGLIRSGEADVVVAGGTEAILQPFGLACFAAMRALSRRNDEPARASRPFDKGRDGFVLGEGAAVVVLESAAHAARRGARVYAALTGIGFSADGHDFAQPDPSGAGQATAIRRALADGRLTPDRIAHVNAHAASTPQGDATEALAIRTVLGDQAARAVVTATKSAIGHPMAAAGATESIATILALHHRVVPPTLNLDDYDDEIALDIATEPRELPPGRLAALSNSFGLGGRNVVLAFESV